MGPMCGRFLLTTPAEAIAALLGLESPPDIEARYNIAPTQTVGIVRARSLAQDREWASARWGLVPRWSREPVTRGRPIFNARSEGLAEKAAFRDSFKHRRCLIPANGFYEWKPDGRSKQPYLLRRRDGAAFAFAGLWDRWQPPGQPALDSCTIVTTTPNELLQPLHDRMPVILAPDSFGLWLDPAFADSSALQGMLRPYPSELMVAHPVGSHVNNARFDGPECAEPA
jgi:putative SOS response-associated peptidase YedK